MDVSSYPHSIPPLKHQQDHIERHAFDKAWGLLWEQGTAKTKPTIDTIAILYANKKIDCAIVIAPSGVERNWNSDEIPKHLPPEFGMETAVGIFKSDKSRTREHERKIDALLRFDGLSFLLMSYDGAMTEIGKKTIQDFLKKRRCIVVLDESHNIKAPGAKKTLFLNKVCQKAPYRRILTGTPMAVGPFDLYAQIKFLDEWFWKNKGIDGAQTFRQFFGEYFTRADCQALHGYDPGYDKLMGYKNLDILKKWLAEISDRYEKTDIFDFPEKLYQKRYFDMSREQRSAYNELKEELILKVGENLISGELPIVKLLRLQQITCNYVPTGEDEPVHMFSEKNPRLNIMEDLRDEIWCPTIVWARFRHDVDQLMDLLGKDAVRYDGAVDDDQAERNKKAFQAGDVRWFVGTAQKGGPGLTLTRAKTVVYYSNSFRLIDRLQSEDRAHRVGMDSNPVNYIDLVANDTVDDHIINNLRNKRDIISEIQEDELREWI